MPHSFSRRTLSIALVVACATLALVDCSGVGPSARTQSSGSLSASEILSMAQSAQLKDATFTLSIVPPSGTSTGSSGLPLSLSGAGTLTTTPARDDITFVITVSGTEVNVEEIIDGTTIYLKLPAQAKWLKGGLSSAIGSPRVLDYARLNDVKVIGPQTLNGAATYHLSANVASTGTPVVGSSSAETEDLWIRADDHFPQRIIEHVAGSISTSNSSVPFTLSGSYDFKVDFTAWNTGATIALPDPADVTATGT